MADVQKYRITDKLATRFVCSKSRGITERTVNSIKKLCNEVETVNAFCYLGDRINFIKDELRCCCISNTVW